MKKIIISALIIISTLTINAQNKKTDISNKETAVNPYQNFPWKTTTCAEELLNSYRRLASGTGLQSCVGKVFSVPGYMPAGCFAQQPDSGYVTFSSIYNFITYDVAVFRNVFDYYAPYYNFYGACVPDPIAWAVPKDVTTVNDVYESFLISIKDYKNATDKSYDYLRSSSYVILSDKFDKIITWCYEPKNGYIATHEPANYNSVLSSKGLQVEIKLKTGELLWCYLLNNYDTNGTLTWKDPTGFGTVTEVAAINEQAEPAAISVELSTASLQQNQPNPFNNGTVITYTLPAKFTTAKIKLTDFAGHSIKEIKLTSPGKGTVNLNASALAAGTYNYALYVDDKFIDSKKMVIAK